MSLDSTNCLFRGLWDGFHTFTLGNEVFHVLKRVIIDLFAGGFISINKFSVALEVSWEWSLVVLDGFNMSWEESLESVIDKHSVFDLLLESFTVFFGWISHDQVVEVVELDVSGVNGKLVSSVDFFLVN